MMGKLVSIKKLKGKERTYKIILRLDKNIKPEKFEGQFEPGQILILANFDRELSKSYFSKFETMKSESSHPRSRGWKVTDRIEKCERCKGKGKIKIRKKTGKKVIIKCPDCKEGYVAKGYKPQKQEGKYASKEL